MSRQYPEDKVKFLRNFRGNGNNLKRTSEEWSYRLLYGAEEAIICRTMVHTDFAPIVLILIV